MGDKGGKKDKEKNKQQQLTKQNRRNKRSRTIPGQRLRSRKFTDIRRVVGKASCRTISVH